MRDRASCLRRHLAPVVCAAVLSFAGLHQSAAAANLKSPVLYSVSSASTRAIALESVSLVSEPFSLNMESNFNSSDPRTRISVFGQDFEFLQGEGANALTADAQDGTGTFYSLKVEYAGAVPGFPGVYMVVLRLNDSMAGNLGDVLIRLNLHGIASNRVRVAIGQIGGGPADDPGAVGTPAPATPPGAPTQLSLAQFQAQYNDPSFASDNDLKRFLEQASWGQRGDDLDFNHLRAIGIPAYITE